MDNSLSHWLDLREPADTAARSAALARAVADTLPTDEPIRAVDLATGTGSNIRYLVGRLHGRQRWLALDRSPDLLAMLPRRMSSWGAARGYRVHVDGNRCAIDAPALDCEVETRECDLGPLGLEPGGLDLFAGRHLVTASALLDLVSVRWLRMLAARCRVARAAALFSITYNGRSACQPEEPEDDMVRRLLNEHQERDKGLGGPAVGPAALAPLCAAFAAEGYVVRHEPSDWTLGAEAPDMQKVLIDGWAEAAVAMTPANATAIAQWRDRRLAHVDSGRSRLVVGHDDVGAWLPRDRH